MPAPLLLVLLGMWLLPPQVAAAAPGLRQPEVPGNQPAAARAAWLGWDPAAARAEQARCHC